MYLRFTPQHPWINGGRTIWLRYFPDAALTDIIRAVKCPNDNIELGPVRVESFYSAPVILEQCGGCGGIWFDRYELFSVKPGQAKKIESLDSETLSAPARIISSGLVCPRDQSRLERFSDINFPREIIVGRCRECGGFWLNRGEFTMYQRARREQQRIREKGPEKDLKFTREIQKILSEYSASSATGVIARLGRFLSTPADPITRRPLDPENMPPEEQRAFDIIVNVLTLILRAFVFKGI